jgi:hypothetical protein
MPQLIDVRITVVGTEDSLSAFEQSNWFRTLRAKHVEVFETSDRRLVWWYQTHHVSQHALVRLSLEWKDLTFLIDYENYVDQIKGLIRAIAGKIDHCQFGY